MIDKETVSVPVEKLLQMRERIRECLAILRGEKHE